MKHMKVRHEGEDGALWVADSIVSNVDFNFLAKQMGMKIRNVKAYTAVYDDKSRFPQKNFLEVMNKELADGS